MEDIEIVQLLPEKWKEYKNLRLLAVKENPDSFGLTYKEALKRDDKEWKEMLEEATEKKKRWMFFAKLDDKLVGMLQGTREDETADKVKVRAVFVKPQFRNKGIGKLLMSRLLDEISKAKNVKKVELGVFLPNEAAIKLYESLGFRIVERMVETLGNGRLYNRVAMEKILYKQSLRSSKRSL